jgi:hypothetical protein
MITQAVGTSASDAPATELVDVRFTVPAAIGACYADLVAEFTSWVPLPMDRLGDGRCTITLRLPRGQEWRYRFLIDGESWVNDWAAVDFVVDDDGCAMSLMRT